jgi:TfoX/Sxy family transcriptional regulator of competence genes
VTAASARDQALDIADELHVIGPVEVTRFFGGAGLALDGRQFGFVMKDDLYLKADDLSRPMFEDLGEGPVTYQGRSRTVTVTSYYRVPCRRLLRLWSAPDRPRVTTSKTPANLYI